MDLVCERYRAMALTGMLLPERRDHCSLDPTPVDDGTEELATQPLLDSGCEDGTRYWALVLSMNGTGANEGEE